MRKADCQWPSGSEAPGAQPAESPSVHAHPPAWKEGQIEPCNAVILSLEAGSHRSLHNPDSLARRCLACSLSCSESGPRGIYSNDWRRLQSDSDKHFLLVFKREAAG